MEIKLDYTNRDDIFDGFRIQDAVANIEEDDYIANAIGFVCNVTSIWNIESEAELAHNPRAKDVFENFTKDLDILVRFTAVLDNDEHEHVSGEAFMSDLMAMTMDDDDADAEIAKHFVIRRHQDVA